MQVGRRKQLSIYLENRAGALAEVCEVIEQQRINLIAICAIDGVEEALVRLVPEDAEAAAATLEEAGIRSMETEVLVVELENEPGGAGRVATILAGRGLNIDYLWVTSRPGEASSLLVVRTHPIDEAERALRERGPV
jgi:hypothetical protein